MRVRGFTLASLFTFLFAAAILPAIAQTILATVPVGNDAFYLAANPVTNKIYVANYCGNDPNCAVTSPGTVTVIDGRTNTVDATITVGVHPIFLVINPVTNKIYVSNRRSNSISVINGATNTVTTTLSLPLGSHPTVEDVDLVTNKIYVVNNGNGFGTTMDVIDGNTDTITTMVTVGNYPVSVAVNSVTNKIYVANFCGNDPNCQSDAGAQGTVSVIDGATNNVTATVTVGVGPAIVLVDQATDKIWVENSCGNSLPCDADPNGNGNYVGTVTVIDGVTLAAATANAGKGSIAMALNSVAEKAYVSNSTDNTETFVDEVTLATSTVNVGLSPADVEVNPVTNKIYVCNSGANTVTTIDGATLATTTIGVGNSPVEAWVNPVTNRVYVSNLGDATVSVLGGLPPDALQFIAVAPCRLVDTRNPNGPFGGPPVQGGTARSFPIPQQTPCDIPATAAAYSLNVTLVPSRTPVGFLSIWPTGEVQPNVSTMNSFDGRFKANAAIVPAGSQGAVSVYASNTTDVVLDIDGYFEPVSGSTLAFYPLTPCRVSDTRWPMGHLGGPNLQGGQERTLPILESTCGIPATAQAYSFNFTAIPRGGALWVFTAWPDGQSQPNTSTLNAPTGTVVANAGILPAGPGGAIDVWASNDADLVIDVNGYFAPAGTGGLSLYPVAPCRVLDTRTVGTGQPFTGVLNPPVNVLASACPPPSAAQAYVFNATIVPAGGPVYFLTLWPDGGPQPNASTLNSYDAAVTSNMAIVPTTNGSIDADAAGLTQLILDISSYFAP